MIRQRGVIVVSLLAVVSTLLGDVKVDRSSISNELKQNIVLTKRLEGHLDEEARSQLLTSVQQRADELAANVLPASVSIPSADYKKAVSPGIVIDSTDPKLIELLITKKLMDVTIQVGFINEYPGPNAQEASQVRADLNSLTQGMRKTMQEQIGQYISSSQIEQYVEKFGVSMERQIQSRATYAMKKPLGTEGVTRVLEEFARRLRESADRIPARLAEAEREPDFSKRETLRKRIIEAILSEIVLKSGAFFAKATCDPALAGADPEKYAPGYHDILQQIDTIERNHAQTAAKDKAAKEVAQRLSKYEKEMQPMFEENVLALKAVPNRQPASDAAPTVLSSQPAVTAKLVPQNSTVRLKVEQ